MPNTTHPKLNRQIFNRLVQPSMRTLVFRAGVYFFLLTECLSLYESTVRDIQNHCEINENEILARGIKSCPTWSHNIIGAGACAERFGDLSEVPGFYFVDDRWRLALRPELSVRGFVVPVHHAGLGFIESLQVFRNAKDSKPFTLQVRALRRSAA